MKTLFLFTSTFPFGISTENAFLQNEINYLCKKFDKVIVFPSLIMGKQTNFGEFAVNIEIAEVLIKKNKLSYFILAMKSKFFYKEILSKKISFWNLQRLKRLLFFVAQEQVVKKWAIRYDFKAKVEQNTKLLIYTYWNSAITLALASLFETIPNIKVITRAHRFDLYEEISKEGYLPCYKYVLGLLDKIVLISEDGFNYLLKKYPAIREKIALSYLGVSKANNVSMHSDDGITRIISCSHIISVKRVDLIAKGLILFASKFNFKVKWTHFGDGNLLYQIKKIVTNNQNDYFSFCMKGFLPNKEVLHYYSNNPVDLFITTSESEGLPFSIQEAQAYGIPVIGTAVGGIPEIVNNKVGRLLSDKPSEEEIAEAIYFILSDRDRFLQMRKNSVINWKALFNEKINYTQFINELYELID